MCDKQDESRQQPSAAAMSELTYVQLLGNHIDDESVELEVHADLTNIIASLFIHLKDSDMAD